jgi:hypothetical protein
LEFAPSTNVNSSHYGNSRSRQWLSSGLDNLAANPADRLGGNLNIRPVLARTQADRFPGIRRAALSMRGRPQTRAASDELVAIPCRQILE